MPISWALSIKDLSSSGVPELLSVGEQNRRGRLRGACSPYRDEMAKKLVTWYPKATRQCELLRKSRIAYKHSKHAP